MKFWSPQVWERLLGKLALLYKPPIFDALSQASSMLLLWCKTFSPSFVILSSMTSCPYFKKHVDCTVSTSEFLSNRLEITFSVSRAFKITTFDLRLIILHNVLFVVSLSVFFLLPQLHCYFAGEKGTNCLSFLYFSE